MKPGRVCMGCETRIMILSCISIRLKEVKYMDFFISILSWVEEKEYLSCFSNDLLCDRGLNGDRWSICFWVYRGARAAVWENFKDNPLFDISTEHPATYYEDMQRAVFCLCPLGWAPWSPRLVEAVIFGCIPVIIADDIVLPFADAIPWEEIGVYVDEEDVPNLDTILTSIPPEVILRKQRLLANPSMKQAMLFPQPAQPGDAFHQVLNGLARKLPHDRSVYLRPGEKILNWTAGPVGDLKPW